MKTIELKLYSFDELSEEAKQTAIENYRSAGSDFHWTEENRNSLEKFAEIFPIEVTEAYYGDRGEGVSFHFTTDREEIEELSGWRLAKYLWNNYRSEIFQGKWYSTAWDEKNRILNCNGKSTDRRSKIILEHSGVLTGYAMDDALLNPIYKFLDKPDDRVNFRDLLEECFNEWVKAGNEDIEHQNSDEYIGDTLTANNYLFTEDGEQY